MLTLIMSIAAIKGYKISALLFIQAIGIDIGTIITYKAIVYIVV